MANDTWETPEVIFKQLDDVFQFDIDVAADEGNRKCQKYYGLDHKDEDKRDGLKAPWEPYTVWCNPPYSDPLPWVEKGFNSSVKGATVVMLLPVDTSTKWWRMAFQTADEMWMLYPRVSFIGSGAGAKFPNEIVIWRPKVRGIQYGHQCKVLTWKWNEIEVEELAL